MTRRDVFKGKRDLSPCSHLFHMLAALKTSSCSFVIQRLWLESLDDPNRPPFLCFLWHPWCRMGLSALQLSGLTRAWDCLPPGVLSSSKRPALPCPKTSVACPCHLGILRQGEKTPSLNSRPCMCRAEWRSRSCSPHPTKKLRTLFSNQPPPFRIVGPC